jgi:two-component system NtrC family sensor kinase
VSDLASEVCHEDRVSIAPTPWAAAVTADSIDATERKVNSVRMELEKRFMLGICGLVGAGGVVVYELVTQRVSLLVTVVLIGACVAVVGAAMAHYLLFEPIRQLVIMAKAVGSGDFSKRLHLDRRDEIGSLAFHMDTMCDQLQAAEHASERHIAALEQLRHSDRVATLGRLASSVAHELGNPLNVIELRAQLITSGGAATLQQAEQNASVILEQTRRMTQIIDEILSFARMHPARIKRVDLADVLRKAVALSLHTSRKVRTNIVFEAPQGGIEIHGDVDKLLQLFVNLLINGIEAMPRGGTLAVSTGVEQRAPLDDPEGVQRQYVRVEVADQGVGIAAGLIPKVFDAFFSTKIEEGGTGLGLSIAQSIAHEHAGWISAVSELGHGSTFRVYLPTSPLRDGEARSV